MQKKCCGSVFAFLTTVEKKFGLTHSMYCIPNLSRELLSALSCLLSTSRGGVAVSRVLFALFQPEFAGRARVRAGPVVQKKYTGI